MNPAARDPCSAGWEESQQGGRKVLEGMSSGLGKAGSKWVPGKEAERVRVLKARGVSL